MLKTLVRILVFSCVFCNSCQNESATLRTAQEEIVISPDELLSILGEAYLYGYPLVLMDLTMKVATNIEKPHPTKALAPINQLAHFREFPDHTLTTVVKPNVDTYYSIAWLNLESGPHVLSMPATDRYYVLPFYDAYSNVFAAPGTRTSGTEAQHFLIAGPGWEGKTPTGMRLIQAPTQMVWMLGRIQVNSQEDGATQVRALQDSMKLVPLSAASAPHYTPPIEKANLDMQELIPVKAIREMDLKTYFNQLATLMANNPPKAVDSSIVRRMEKIGLVAGQPFDMGIDHLLLKIKLKALPDFIHQKMEKRRADPPKAELINGWTFVTEGIGTYGTDYLRRAYIGFVGLGACIPEDAVYPNCTYDINGQPLNARNQYQIHFEADQIPPVNAFWSLTAYNADEFLVENDLNRFALGDRDDLIYNEDGSLDLFIQSGPPSKELLPNWLPIPKAGPFYLTLRLYWPKEEVLSGHWEPPFVIPVK